MFLSAASILAIFVVNTLEFIVNHFFSNRRLGNLESQRACCQLRFVAGLKLGTQAEQGRERLERYRLSRNGGQVPFHAQCIDRLVVAARTPG